MADSTILVTESGAKKLQSYNNTVAGNSVDAEAIVLVKSDSTPYDPTLWADIVQSATIATAGDAVTISIAGRSTVGARIASGFTGIIVFEVSGDGSLWTTTSFWQGSAIVTSLTSPGNINGAFLDVGGMKQVRIRALTTGGSALMILNASFSNNLLIPRYMVGEGSAIPSFEIMVGGSDGTNAKRLVLLNSGPVGTEYGVVTRNIPSGTQTVSAANLDVALSTRLADAKLPATAALADATANPTLSEIQTFPMGFNGATWDRLQVDASKNLKAQVASWIGSVAPTVGQKTMANSLPVAIASDQSSLALMNTGDGRVNVSKTGTVTTTAATADQVVLTYTVTTNKTFYITHFDVSADFTTLSATGAYIGTASLELPSGTKIITQDFQNQTDEQIDWKHWTFTIPKFGTTAQVVRVVCTPSGTTSTRWRANFGGFEL